MSTLIVPKELPIKEEELNFALNSILKSAALEDKPKILEG